MPNGFSAVTSMLLARGWRQSSEGPQGQMWAKGGALTPVAFNLEPQTFAWRQFLDNVASVERESPEEISRQASEYLEQVRVRRRKQSRTELDLHLKGASVSNHEASAHDFGRFVSNVSSAVAALVVDRFALQSYEPRLKVVGAKAGSVRVQFREPVFDPRSDERLFEQAGDTPESLALLRLAQILNVAQDAAEMPVDHQLDAALDVNVKARRSLQDLATRIYQSGWRVDGLLLGFEEILPVSIGTSGAWRLKAATSQSSVKTRVIEAFGVLDSWSWSKATMTLLQESARPLRIAVPPELQARVAELNSTKGQQLVASLQVFERQAPNSAVITKAFSLLGVEPVERLV